MNQTEHSGHDHRPLRILHALGSMDVGGIETWLKQVLAVTDRDRYRIDLLLLKEGEGFYDQDVLAMGSTLIRVPDHGNPLRFGRAFHQALVDNGPYDVLHSHLHHFAGYTLLLGRLASIPVRVAHSHLDTRLEDGQAGPLRAAYLKAMDLLLRSCATDRLACSAHAAAALYGADWERDRDIRLLYCGCDLAPYRTGRTGRGRDGIGPEVRAEIGAGERTLVLGHVGRFSEAKNHSFLLDILGDVVALHDDTILLLIGDGPLRPAMERKAAALGLDQHVRFLGLRRDVFRLLQAMDAFVFPSLVEGLPVSLLEAQLAGLPIVRSDVITGEADVIPGLARALSPAASSGEWAKEVMRSRERRIDASEAYAVFERSPFNVENSARAMLDVYAQRLGATPARLQAGARRT